RPSPAFRTPGRGWRPERRRSPPPRPATGAAQARRPATRRATSTLVTVTAPAAAAQPGQEPGEPGSTAAPFPPACTPLGADAVPLNVWVFSARLSSSALPQA